MKITRILFTFSTFIICGLLCSIFAQCGTVTAGTVFTGLGGTVSFTIGQVDYTTITGSGGIITQGIQQPFEIWTVTGVEVKGIDLEMVCYPNPTTDFVQLLTQQGAWENLNYSLSDMGGTELLRHRIEASSTQISMVQYAAGTYVVKVYDGQKSIKSFKIVKSK